MVAVGVGALIAAIGADEINLGFLTQEVTFSIILLCLLFNDVMIDAND